MKLHLKRIAAPRTWDCNRKGTKFIIRPKTTGHPMGEGISLGFFIREHLKLAMTLAEVKRLLCQNEVLVNGKQEKDPHSQIGLFDIVSLPQLGKSFEVAFDKKGRIAFFELATGKENAVKLAKVTGKSLLRGGKVQLHLHDGKNLLYKEPVGIGDTLLLQIPQLKVIKVLPLQPGSSVYLTRGAHCGSVGVVETLESGKATYVTEGKKISTTGKNLFVIPGQHLLMDKSAKKTGA